VNDVSSSQPVDDSEANETGFRYFDLDDIRKDDPSDRFKTFADYFGVEPPEGAGLEPLPEHFGITTSRYLKYRGRDKTLTKITAIVLTVLLLTWFAATPILFQHSPIKSSLGEGHTLRLLLVVLIWIVVTAVIAMVPMVVSVVLIQPLVTKKRMRSVAWIFAFARRKYYQNALMGIAAYWQKLPRVTLIRSVVSFLEAQGLKCEDPVRFDQDDDDAQGPELCDHVIETTDQGERTIVFVHVSNEPLTKVRVEEAIRHAKDVQAKLLIVARCSFQVGARELAERSRAEIIGPREIAERHRNHGMATFVGELDIVRSRFQSLSQSPSS
jgi:hypothetical protein